MHKVKNMQVYLVWIQNTRSRILLGLLSKHERSTAGMPRRCSDRMATAIRMEMETTSD